MKNFLDKFTINYKKTISNAYKLAWENNNKEICPEHIFYSLVVQKGKLSNQVLKKLKITQTQLKKELIKKQTIKNKEIKERISPDFSRDSKNIIKKSAAISNNLDHKFIGTEHLLMSIIQSRDAKLTSLFKKYKLDILKLEEQVSLTLKTISRFSNFSSEKYNTNEMLNLDMLPEEQSRNNDHNFTIELTEKENVEKFDPVIARESEIERIIQILCRRKKNNPLLLGEPGVGKTAIIEGLAKKIADADVPSPLLGKKIIKLDLGSAIAGTMFRGEFESRIKKTIDEIQNDPHAILFIDEIHTIVGAGVSGGSLDAANILKPALSRGEFSLIGATTYSDYKKNIEKDPALIRRFDTIKIEEPNTIKSKEILSQLKEYYEAFHQIEITESAINSAISLSNRYMPSKFLPDKAIDLIDEAASSVKLKKQKHNIHFIEIEFEKKFKELRDKKRQYINNENYAGAIELKKQEENLKKEFSFFEQFKEKAKAVMLGKITSKDVIVSVSRATNIPIEQLSLENRENILNIEKKLNTKIVGQKEAISVITKYLKKSLLNMSHPERPLGSFLFLGPTGVGKTELAKEISNLAFGDKKSLIKLDMSEFSDKFNASKLIGAPAGYVGYEEGGKLTEFIKHNPYSVVLFDEIEKAHPSLFNLLLQILEDGVLTDASGSTIDFKNTLIIMTSNVGMEDFYSQKNIGFGSKKSADNNFNEVKSKIGKNIKKILKPELLSRLDQILVFNPLKEKDIKKIVKLQLKELNERISEKSIELISDEEAIKYLSSISNKPSEGARAVRKTIQEKIEDELIEIMLKNKKDDIIKVGQGTVRIKKN